MVDASFIPSSEAVESSRLFKALTDLNQTRASSGESSLATYQALHQWSVTQPEAFWRWALDALELEYEGNADQVVSTESDRIGGQFFPNLTLNFTDNLLKHGAPDQPAIIALSEGRGITTRTYKELSDEVDALAYYLHAIGIQPGDRVAGLTSNSPEAVISLLACAAIGAVYTSASPEFGMEALEARFGQVAPKVIIACNGYAYGGKTYDSRIKVNNLLKTIPSIEHIILYEESPELDLELYVEVPAVTFDAATSCAPDETFLRPKFPFNHPLYILYSSGTTGKPKCLVHGIGGTLLQHAKEHRWQGDLQTGDKVFYSATCGWMTWNWLISGLQAGATICLYDGAPNPSTLCNFAKEQSITHFGASPGFFDKARADGSLKALSQARTVYSTGAPLHQSLAKAIQDHLPTTRVQSICGGTDIVSCFLTGNPMEAIYAGEIQSAGLGMAIITPDSNASAGFTLTCKTPFPSMPIYLWGDDNDDLYKSTYLPNSDGIWHQGDWCVGYPHDTQSMGIQVIGRIDGTLNPNGIRFGPADVYAAIDSVTGIEDAVAISKRKGDTETFVLLVKSSQEEPNQDQLTQELIQTISENLSPRHKPHNVMFIDEVPKTLSGKKVETLISKALIQGTPVDTSSLSNPGAFEAIIERLSAD